MTQSTPHLLPLFAGESTDFPPLFCFPAAAATPVSLYILANLIPSPRPVYSCLYDGIRNDVDPQHRVEDIAAQLLQEIKQIQPTGPYVLGGFCLGGLVALDLARKLQVKGDEIAMLIMLDTIPPTGIQPLAALKENANSDAEKKNLEHVEFFLEAVRVMDASMEEKLVSLPFEMASKIRRARDTHNFAGVTYSCPPVDIPITVIHSGLNTRDVFAVWSKFTTSQFSQITVSGDTLSMLASPVAEVVATRIGEVLEICNN